MANPINVSQVPPHGQAGGSQISREHGGNGHQLSAAFIPHSIACLTISIAPTLVSLYNRRGTGKWQLYLAPRFLQRFKIKYKAKKRPPLKISTNPLPCPALLCLAQPTLVHPSRHGLSPSGGNEPLSPRVPTTVPLLELPPSCKGYTNTGLLVESVRGYTL